MTREQLRAASPAERVALARQALAELRRFQAEEDRLREWAKEARCVLTDICEDVIDYTSVSPYRNRSLVELEVLAVEWEEFAASGAFHRIPELDDAALADIERQLSEVQR